VSSQRLERLLSCYGLSPGGGCALFQQVESERAVAIFETLAKKGVLVRLFKEQGRIRFGLPKNEVDWQQLEKVLSIL
jgi:hypothetical protein